MKFAIGTHVRDWSGFIGVVREYDARIPAYTVALPGGMGVRFERELTALREISAAEWKILNRHGYASIRDGQRYILTLEKKTQATILEPVVVR